MAQPSSFGSLPSPSPRRRRSSLLRSALLLGSSALVLSGCLGRSEHEIQAEFDAFVAAHNQCATSEECVLASAGCPLGCSAAVNAAHRAAVERKASELIDEYQGNGRRCEYECVAVKASCVEDHCQAVAE